jgi:predicted CoA-substrate-specific enzyme activase
MIVAGCDFGTLAVKVAVMKDESVVSSEIDQIRALPEQVATDAVGRALSRIGLSSGDLDYSVSTGWGRKRVPYAGMEKGEMPCLAKGALWLMPSVRAVIDVGGQSVRALSLSDAGRVVDYTTNDKCAAGTGRFFELVAEALELSLEDLAPLAFQSRDPAKISSQCCVFAESEVVTLVNEGRDLADIVAGVHDSVVRRLAAIAGTIGIAGEVVMTGGCAKNERLVRGLESLLKVEIQSPPVDPQLVGAIGAALFAREKLKQA